MVDFDQFHISASDGGGKAHALFVSERFFCHCGDDFLCGVLTPALHQTTAIALRRGDGDVTKLGLNKFHAGTGIQEKSAADMPQVVRPDTGNAGDGIDVALDNGGQPLTASPVPLRFSAGEGAEFMRGGRAEQRRGIGSISRANAGGQIKPDGALGKGRELHAAVLVALAVLDVNLTVFKVEIAETKVEQFRISDLARQQNRRDGVISRPHRFHL